MVAKVFRTAELLFWFLIFVSVCFFSAAIQSVIAVFAA